MYLLDTNAVIAALKGHAGVLARLRAQRPQDVFVSAIVLHELYFGAFRSARLDDNLRRIDELQFQVLDFDREDGRQAGAIRAALAASGLPIGPYDVLIAGQAKSRDYVLVSRNLREFARVESLRIEDWETE
ncbi:MAG: type II toxin-antitoxin system VapC family toxin [Mesorhizobium sp.]|nr:type II toxin-antitoxin system VapC family toxin [Mesorhizobium sp.]